MNRPIIWALGFLIAGIVAGMAGFAMPLFIAAVFVCAGLYRVYRYKPVAIFALFFLVGAWRVEQSVFSHTYDVIEGVVFYGTVLDTGYTAGGNQRAVVRGSHPSTGERVRVMAYIRPHQPHVRLGQQVTLTGDLLPLIHRENPVGFNQFQHFRAQKIDATIWPERIERGEVRRTPLVLLREFRDSLAAVYDEILPPRESAVIKSMVLGDRLDMDRDLADLYRTMGIFHILSISGLHVTVLMVAANKLLSLVIVNERRGSFIVLGVMIAYCLMTGAAVATVRAVTMGGVLVGAKIFYRDYDLLASVSLAGVALLLYEPLFLFNVGFQLSFGAVFGIGTLTAPVERLFIMLRCPARLRKELAFGTAAVVSTYIIFAHHFYEIPLYSVLGNLVIAPTVTIILVGGILVGLIGLVFMPAAFLLGGMIYFVLQFYEASAVFFSGLPFAMVLTGGGSVVVSALGVAVLCTFAYAFHGFGEELKKRLRYFAVSIALLVVAVFIHLNPPQMQLTEFENYTVIRRGADTLVIGAPHGGEGLLVQYLDKYATRRASLLLTTPPHPNDTARLAQILPRFQTIYLPAHAEGVTLSLMNEAFSQLSLPYEVVFLRHGDIRTKNNVNIQVFALPMGRFEYTILEE
ncbi:MAG: ComEC family competence protein [Defluviitaleaceae bacterium]|nr:ComEC family competence protein [Defluviitaleaceae bacterium]